MTRGDVLTLRGDVLVRLFTGHDLATFVRPRTNGGYVIGTRGGIALSDSPDLAAGPEITMLDTNVARMNDGTATPSGQLLAGSMAWDGTSPVGKLDLVDTSMNSSRVLESIVCSNGVDFAPSGDLVYYVDTATSRIDVLDHDEGALKNRRPFVSIDPDLGLPDGLTVDSSGTVWVALWGGSAVHAYDPDGSLAEVITVQARQVSACAFGDDDLGTLYITTSRHGLGEGEDTAAGSLFAARPGPTGQHVRPFSG